MGLRESKKQRMRGQIIENAIVLFRERGFEGTPVRDIAAAADISDATFFNYFATKDAVLSSWVHELLEPVPGAFSSAERATSLRAFLRGWLRDLAKRIEADRALMALAWSRLRVVPPASGAAVGAGTIARALREGQERGEIRGDLPAEQLAQILRGALASSAGAWLCGGSGSGDAEPLADRLLRCLDLILDGSRKRHERVRLAAKKAARASVPAAP
jgi:AcrR family transcriptional regulator